MCYLLAKKFKEPGSVALKIRRGTELADFSSQLQKKLGKEVHLITVTRPVLMENMLLLLLSKIMTNLRKQPLK